MRFEREKDIERENKAIEAFLKPFNGTYDKLGCNDIDFKIYDDTGKTLAFVEVKGRLRNMQDAFPLPVSVKKLIKLIDKKINPIIIWACFDGLIYSEVKHLKGELRVGGRKPRDGSSNDIELMAYFDKEVSGNIKFIKY
tara:strand:- start:123 stop:539 length:417 start_codon:yes stop_codon:yes gene_type:complete